MMKTSRGLGQFIVVLLLAGGAPLTQGETEFASSGVQAQVSFPLDPMLPEELGVNASFVPPDGVFCGVARGGYRFDEESCAASLNRTTIDEEVYDLTDYLRGVKGRIEVPTEKNLAYQIKLKVRFTQDNAAAWPFQPIGGSTEFAIGDEVGMALHTQVEWQGMQQLGQ